MQRTLPVCPYQHRTLSCPNIEYRHTPMLLITQIVFHLAAASRLLAEKRCPGSGLRKPAEVMRRLNGELP